MTAEQTQMQCTCGASLPAEGLRCLNCGKERLKVLGGKWRVDQRLGVGGMGAVYLATDLSLGRQVAVKVLHPALAEDKSFVARFQREARTMARLDHPSLVPIYAIEQSPDGLLLVMKYIEGVTLAAHLKAQGRLWVSETLSLVTQLVAAVGAMHRHGLVHRDLKPSNLIVQKDGRLVLLDFGLARRSKEVQRLTEPGTALGSGPYMAPEQARDLEIDGRTDLYAVGVITFECLAGQVPFPGEAMHALFQRLTNPPPLVSDVVPKVPERVARVIEKAMALEPSARQADLDTYLAELKAAVDSPAAKFGDDRTTVDEARTQRASEVETQPGRKA